MYKEQLEQAHRQNCSNVLRHLGHHPTVIDKCEVDGHMLSIDRNRWYDIDTGEHDAVKALAVRLVGEAASTKLLIEASGFEYSPEHDTAAQELRIDDTLRVSALGKLAAIATLERAPDELQRWLQVRCLDGTRSALGYLADVESLRGHLSDDELSRIDAPSMVGKLIIWDMSAGIPAGFWLLDMDSDDVHCLRGPCILNAGVLMGERDVLLCADVMDYLTLRHLGLAVACAPNYRLTGDVKHALRFYLRCRALKGRDWTARFVLDTPMSPAAVMAPPVRELLCWLFEEGVQGGYVQMPRGQTIHELHVAGQAAKVQSLTASRAGWLELHPFFTEERTESMLLARIHRVAFTSPRALDYRSRSYNASLGSLAVRVMKSMTKRSVPWDEVYDTERIKFMYHNEQGVHVLFYEDTWPGNRLQTFAPAVAANALRDFRIYPFDYDMKDIRTDYRKDVYVVGGEQMPSAHEFNRYTKTTYLMERLEEECVYPMPPFFTRLLQNLGCADVIGCLLNVLAHFCQKFQKPQVIPYLTGGQGTGKGTLATIMGTIIGDFTIKSTQNILEPFDGWKATSAVVLLDEIRGETEPERKRIERNLLPLVNVQQSVRRMFAEAETHTVNNLIIIANNSSSAHSVFRLSPDDRRFLVVSGGENQKLTATDWWDRDALMAEIPDIARHLRTRPVDIATLHRIPQTADRQRLIRESIPPTARMIEHHLRQRAADGHTVPELIALTDLHADLLRLHPRDFAGIRPQDVKRQMEQFLGVADGRYWRRPNNKTHFVYAMYHEEHIAGHPQHVDE